MNYKDLSWSELCGVAYKKNVSLIKIDYVTIKDSRYPTLAWKSRAEILSALQKQDQVENRMHRSAQNIPTDSIETPSLDKLIRECLKKKEKVKKPDYSKYILKKLICKPKKKCSCDLRTILMVTGCQCGGV